MATVNEQLAQAIKAQEEATAKVEELKKATKAADLATVRELIKLHGFGPTDLRSVIKAKRKRSSGTTTARKTTGSTRKSTAAKKKAK